jgi:hypothetical protein
VWLKGLRLFVLPQIKAEAADEKQKPVSRYGATNGF